MVLCDRAINLNLIVLMLQVFLFLAESIAVSAILYLLYFLLFLNKASFFAQRLILMLIPLVALLSAIVSVDLIGVSTFDFKPAPAAEIVDVPLEEYAADDGEELFQELSQSVETDDFVIIRTKREHPIGLYVLLLVWVGVSAFFALRLYRSVRRMSILQMLADKKEEYSDYTLYRLACDGMIFSFWRGVYMSASLDGEKFDLALRHELGHIRHRHYIDKLVAELYLVFMWFNPMMRIIQRELSLIHEYEADHVVMTSDCDTIAYQFFLLEVATAPAPTPTVANGLNSSQIKKRFAMIKRDYKVTHRVLRVLVTTATFILIAVSSLLYVKAENPTNEPNASAKRSVVSTSLSFKLTNDSAIVTSIGKSNSGEIITNEVFVCDLQEIAKAVGTEADNLPLEDIQNYILGLFSKKVMTEEVLDMSPEAIAARAKAEEERKKAAEEREAKIERVYLFPDDCQWVKFDNPNEYSFVYYTFVIRHKTYTQVDFVVNVQWDWHWVGNVSVSYLQDHATGDKYMFNSIVGDYPMDKTLVFREQKGKTTVITKIYPPLDKGVTMVDLVGVDNPDVVYPLNAMSDDPYCRNLKVYDSVDDLPYSFVAKPNSTEEAKVITLDKNFKLPKKDSKLYR